MDWDLSKSDYAKYEDLAFDVGMGDSANGWGYGHAGVFLKNIRSMELDVTMSRTFQRLDDNSFSGFVVDYHSKSGFVSRVALSTGFYSPQRWNHTPFWGKHSKVDKIVDLGKHRNYKLDLQKWAPPKWDGSCWFIVCLENAGINKSLQVRITRMTGPNE